MRKYKAKVVSFFSTSTLTTDAFNLCDIALENKVQCSKDLFPQAHVPITITIPVTLLKSQWIDLESEPLDTLVNSCSRPTDGFDDPLLTWTPMNFTANRRFPHCFPIPASHFPNPNA